MNFEDFENECKQAILENNALVIEKNEKDRKVRSLVEQYCKSFVFWEFLLETPLEVILNTRFCLLVLKHQASIDSDMNKKSLCGMKTMKQKVFVDQVR